MIDESMFLITTGYTANSQKEDTVGNESRQKLVVFKDHKNNEKKRFLKWGASAFLTIAVAWCVTCISFSLSYEDDPIVEKWDEYAMTAKEKVDLIWDRVASSDSEPEPWPSIIEQMIRFFALETDDISCLKWQQIFRPFKNKKKVIHTQAAFVKIKWVPVKNNMGYTGLFADGEVDGLVSFSLPLDSKIGNFSSGIGVGVRLFRDNAPPSSFVSMFPLPVYKLFTPIRFMYNIFETGPLCTHISVIGGLNLLIGSRQRPTLALPPKFVFQYPNSVGLLNLVNMTKSGKHVLHPKVPYCICLRANPKLAELLENQPPWDHPVAPLRNVPPESLLYDIIAIDHPKALLDFPNINKYAVKVGEIWSDSEFVSSKWGDQMLFTQHQDWKLDIASRPDWKSHMNFKTLILEGWAYYSISPPKGPSAKQFNELLFPAFATVFRFFSNPTHFLNFLRNDLGLYRLGEALESAIRAQDIRTTGQMIGYENSEDEMKSNEDEMKSNEDEMKSNEDEMKSNEDKMSGYHFFGYRSYSIETAWQDLLSRWFSIPPKFNSPSHDILSMIFAPMSPAFWNNFVSENEKLLKNSFLPNFEAEGHFLLPSTFLGLQQTLTNPYIATCLVSAVEHIIKPYSVKFSHSTILNIINELVALLQNPRNITRFFTHLSGFSAAGTSK